MTADVPLTFLVKRPVRIFYYLQSIRWQRTRALVTGHNVLDAFFGCPSVNCITDLIQTDFRPKAAM